MKRLIPILVVVLAGLAFYFRGTWLPPPEGQGDYLGYVEGETVMIAAPAAGRIVARPVAEGGEVEAGKVVFSLDTAAAEAEVLRAEANVAELKAQHANLLSGKREAEINVIRAQRREAEAALTFAKLDLARIRGLVEKDVTARLSLDQALAQVDELEAKVDQFKFSEAAATLGGRDAELAAAAARIAQAEASLAAARTRLADLAPTAPLTARVERTYFDAGEWVAAGQPVVSLLAPGNIKLRFFIPETDVAKARIGSAIAFICDGCGGDLAATITHVASRAEYTPPVIYSQGARAKLVYLVEARPATPVAALLPGLPIQVHPLSGSTP